MTLQLPDSAKSAREVGSRLYFTGKACKHGHVSPRTTNNGCCVECTNLASNAWGKRNRPRRTESLRKWRETDRERYLQVNRDNAKAFRIRHASEIKARYSTDDEFRARRIKYTSDYAAKKICATPPWLTQEHRNEIASVYRRARKISRETGVDHHVDHIEPLRGANSCGLHVPWNLQVLEAVANMQKGNRLAA